MSEVYERVADTLTHFHDKMADEKAVFKSSTVDNLHELVALLPALNLTNDPRLTQIGEAMERAIRGLDAPTLRKEKDTRAAVANDVKQIIDDMSGFMKAFGGGK